MNLSEILHKRAIKLTLRHQTTLKHCAAADSRYFNQLNRTRLGKSVILASILKSPAIPLKWSKLVLMFLLSKEHTWGIGIRTLCDFLSLRIHYVPTQRLNVSGG